MNALVDDGALFRETIYDWADRHPDWAAEIRMWYDRWIELAAPGSKAPSPCCARCGPRACRSLR